MPSVYATASDITAFGRTLTSAEQSTAEALLETASAKLRIVAHSHGVDIDKKIADEETGEDYALAVKNTVVQAVIRALNSIADTDPAVSSGTQSALGYSVQVSYVNAGQSLYFLKNELRELNILRQVFGGLELYKHD